MATFQTVYDRVEKDIHKATGTTYQSDVKNAIVSAIRFYEQRPVWFTEVVGSDLTLTAASDNVALPTNFASLAHLRIVVNSQFRDEDTGFAPVNDLKELRKKTGATQRTMTPSWWTLHNTKIYVDTLADSEYTLKIDYHKKDTSYPSSSGDTSIWFEEAFDLIRLMAMSIHYGERLHDSENEAKYFAKAEGWFKNLRARSNVRKSYRMP